MTDRLMTRCVCGERSGPVISEKDNTPTIKCDHCGVLRTLYRAAEYEKTYSEGEAYHAGAFQEKYNYPTYMERFAHDGKIAELRIPYYMAHFRALDVGCANGAFVQAMDQRGWCSYGLEPNPSMGRWAAERVGRPVFETYAAVEATFGLNAFDLITYLDVFEHVVDPRAELLTIRRMIRDSGLLVLDVPDGAEVFGPNARAPRHEKPEQHLWYWTAPTLRRLLAEHSWVVQSIDYPIVGKLVVTARPNSLRSE